MGFTAAELAQYEGSQIDDLLPQDLRLLFVGINPSLWSAAVNAHFARPGNRFWPALAEAGITPRVINASGGMSADDVNVLSRAGVGITNLVNRATARAAELDRMELRVGVQRLERLVVEHRPRVVAVAGITAFRTAFERPKAQVGPQGEDFAGATLFVVPNPSGLNAHETVLTLATAYRAAADAAGVADCRR
jgi:TDG/mug DNA glycosylase family protein